jgi:nucleoid-associated protein YgaU
MEAGRGRGTGSSRVEPNLHVVERGDNFWTISRQYWGSGRYYKALWKANSDKYPDINVLHVNDVIVIPAIEDLDPAYILAPGAGQTKVARGSRKDDATSPAESATASPRSATANYSARRTLRSDTELDLPESADAISNRSRVGRRNGLSRAADVDRDNENMNDEPEIRQVARPRRDDPPARRPVYKVRRNDTLRSIARDTLNNYRRADEILELNRDVIKDPSQLVVGQILELPEDAKTASRR